MKQWLSASEIAALRLPGLPASKRGVQFLAQRRQWKGRKREGQGGGIEYPVDVLPVEARAAYVAQHVQAIEVPKSIAREASTEAAAISLSGPATEARDARLALLAVVDRYAADAKLPRKRADQHFSDLYRANRIEIADWIRAEVKSLTPRTLARWRAARTAGRLSALAVDRSRARRGTGVLDRANGGAVKTFILALLAKQPQLTAHHIRALVAERFDDQLRLPAAGRTTADLGAAAMPEKAVPIPPVRTFQYALKAWRTEYRNELTALRDPDGFKSRVRFAARVSMPAARLNERWQIDASPADVLVLECDGVARYSIYVCEDLYSRRLIGLVSKTPRATAVGLLIRKAIIAWGVPERIETDRGADFVARETQRLLAALGVEWDPVPPFSPEKKGHVERAIGTLQRGLMRTLPGFTGHNVAERKIIEGRKAFAQRLGEAPEDTFQVQLTAAELQQRVDEWCAVVYANAPHAGLKGQTPFAVAAGYAGEVRRITDIRALDMLLAPVAGKNGLRTVTKTGIRVDGVHYLPHGAHLNVGDEIMVRMDPADMGRAYAYSADGARFLGELVAPEVLGLDPAAAIAAARAEQKRVIDERMASAKAEARRIRPKDMAPAIARQAAKVAGKLVEFPRSAAPHDTPQLAAARAATAAHDAAVPSFNEEVLALHAQLQAGAGPKAPVKKLREQETAHQRFRRACDLEAALARGENVSADDLVWLGGYREGPEYRGFRLAYGDGDAEISDRSQRRTS
jgi:putative transposase